MSLHIAGCRCGRVKLEAQGEPILVTACDCSSCRQAGKLFETLPGGAPVLDAGGATPYMVYRKDRVRCADGAALLAEHRLTPDSPTRRVLATCYNSAMFADFTRGHWISIYRDRLPLDLPAVSRKSAAFILRLVWAWVRMGFRMPRIDYVRGGTHAAEG